MTIGRITEYFSNLIQSRFTGWIRIHFVKGLMKKVEKGETIDLT